MISECDSCGYETEVKIYNEQSEENPYTATPAKLCYFCANTPAGNAFRYPSIYPNKNELKTICFVANHICREFMRLIKTLEGLKKDNGDNGI